MCLSYCPGQVQDLYLILSYTILFVKNNAVAVKHQQLLDIVGNEKNIYVCVCVCFSLYDIMISLVEKKNKIK